MEWMCHYDMHNFDILDSSLRNLKRYFTDREIKNDFSDLMFEVFNAKLKKVGIKPASFTLYKNRLSTTTPAPEWEQLREIVLTWI